MAGVSKVVSCLRQTVCAEGLAGMPDRQLLEQFIRERDEAAFAALVRRHGAMVWGVCRRLLCDRQDAEDAFQATFLVLVRRAASIRRGELLANWLFGVARRAAWNARALRARRAQHEQVGRSMPDVEAACPPGTEDGSAVLDEELAKLPDKYRLPILLCGLEGMTHADAGRKLGWPTGTVAARMSRGRTLLRARLQRRGVAVSSAMLMSWFAQDAAWAAVPRGVVAATVQNASLGASAVPAQVAAVTQGVLKKMLLTRILTGAALCVATVVLGSALGHFANGAPTSTTTPSTRSTRDTPAAGDARMAVEDRRKPSLRLPSLRLPDDPQAVVLRMERFIDPRQGPRTVTTVYADGRMTVEVPESVLSLSPTALTKHAQQRAAERAAAGPVAAEPAAAEAAAEPATAEPGAAEPGVAEPGVAEPEKTKVVEMRLAPAELEELFRFALHEQEFFDFDTPGVQAAIVRQYQSDGAVHDPLDATTTQLRIRTAAKEHEARWTRLTYSAFKFADVKALAKLYAVDMRLRHLFAVELAGGIELVESVVTRTNELARPWYERNPDLPRLTAQDLAGVSTLPDGRGTRFSFSRPKGVARFLVAVAVDVAADGKATIHSIMLPQ